MNILSLFDGISCGRIALERAGIPVTKYYASEIDKYAMQVSQKNWPDIVQLGDVTKWREWDLPQIDLMMGGFPCTSLSAAARQKESGLEKGESTLFWYLAEVFNHYKPKYFLFENVASMKSTDRDRISEIIGVQPVKICSSVLSGQNRKRLYWHNIPNFEQIVDKGIKLEHILDQVSDKKYLSIPQDKLQFNPENICCLSYGRSEEGKKARTEFRRATGLDGGPRDLKYRAWVEVANGKTITLTTGNNVLIHDKVGIRKITVLEAERLQNLPDGYCDNIPKNQAFKCIGNGWTIDVIAYILKGLI